MTKDKQSNIIEPSSNKSKTSFKSFTKVHNSLRKKSNFYDRWHDSNHYSKIHHFMLFLIIIIVSTPLIAIAIAPNAKSPQESYNTVREKIIYWVYGPSEPTYNPGIEKDKIKKLTLDFYHAYQELNPQEVSALTQEPLTLWEKKHSETLREQQGNYKEPKIEAGDLIIEFNNFTANETNITVKRTNSLKTPMPFKFGETTQGEMEFKLKKEENWKIINRTYYSLWVSAVY